MAERASTPLTAGGASAGSPGDAELARITLECDPEADVRVVAVEGEIDISNVVRLRDAILALPNAALGLVLDLQATAYIDSSAIRLLYELRDRLSRRGQVLCVLDREGSNVRRVLELTGFCGRDEERPGSAQDAAATIRRRLRHDVEL